jgi:EAL domain-containing protein (putative c-di-GMP-specific phosphodiesterase class I)/CheY-like chemotaxis protein
VSQEKADPPAEATIRMSLAEHPDLAHLASLVDEPAPDSQASPRGHVLLVESDPARPIAIALIEAGFEVSFTDDGAAAFVMLESADRGAASTEPFDAVLTDVSVKGIGGLDLLRFARHVDGDMPVVLMADARDVESAAEAVEHGAFQYLLKPLPQGRVIDALEKAIRRRRELRAAAMESLERTVETAEPDRERWENALRTVWMAYQPIVLPSGKLYAYEALVRSEEPTLAGAGPLLDMADALNGVRDLGRVVRRRAGDFAVKAAGSHYLFVNLHADDLLDELLTSPSSPLSQVAPAVVLEITERAAMHDIEEAKVKMAELRSLGFRIALDDLGAGYAGLTSFVHVKPEIVKLDMALVRDIDKDPLRRKLVASVIQVSRDIGTLVVGEGVETKAERDVLVDLGCHLLQGYLFGKPERR